MAAPRYITPIKLAIVDLLVEGIGYLDPSNCQAIADVATWDSVRTFGTPFCFVKYSGSSAQPPENLGTNPVCQISRFEFLLFLGAPSFSADGAGVSDDELAGRLGLESMVDDVWWALAGQRVVHSDGLSKLYAGSDSAPMVEGHRVSSTQSWYCDVVRYGQPLTD